MRGTDERCVINIAPGPPIAGKFDNRRTTNRSPGERLMSFTEEVRAVASNALKRALKTKDLIAVVASLQPTVQYPSIESPGDTGITRLLVFAPHPDDEVLGCGGTIALYRSGGSSVRVIYMTDGGLGSPRFEPGELAKERKREAVEGLGVLGCSDVRFLDYPDCGLRCTRESIGRALEQIEDYRPDAIFVPFPLDNHPDHFSTVAIVGAALEEYPEEVRCYCYEVWSALPPNTIVDISMVAAKKEEAIRKHLTQTEIIDYTDKIMGLNAYRSLTAGSGISSCEAFFKCSRGELIDLLKKMRVRE